MMAWKQSFQGSRTYVATQRCCKPSEIVEQRRSSWRKGLEKTPCGYGAEWKNVRDDMEKDGVLPVEDVWRAVNGGVMMGTIRCWILTWKTSCTWTGMQYHRLKGCIMMMSKFGDFESIKFELAKDHRSYPTWFPMESPTQSFELDHGSVRDRILQDPNQTRFVLVATDHGIVRASWYKLASLKARHIPLCISRAQ
jgi:hypothetical protein